jgi:hypothetical protein
MAHVAGEMEGRTLKFPASSDRTPLVDERLIGAEEVGARRSLETAKSVAEYRAHEFGAQ